MTLTHSVVSSILLLGVACNSASGSLDTVPDDPPGDSTVDKRVKDILERARRCVLLHAVQAGDRDHVRVSLITTDAASGFPSSRVVVSREIAQDLSAFRLNTRPGTRKVADIGGDSRVALNFVDGRGRGGWVTIKGVAKLGSPNTDGSVDIFVRAVQIDAMNYNEILMQDTEGWVPAILVRDQDGWVLGGS